MLSVNLGVEYTMVQNRHVELIKRGATVLVWVLMALIVIPVTALISTSLLPLNSPLLGLGIGVVVMLIVYYIGSHDIEWV